MVYDVLIIGAGIIGSAIAHELSRYSAKVCIIEKENDVACGTSKANSGIIHAGYDPEPESLMARFNVEGNRMFPHLAEELHFDFRQTGSLVIAFNEKEREHLVQLRNRGIQNGTAKTEILTQDALKEMEPNISSEIQAALYAPSAGIINPYQATWAFAENAVQNGIHILLNTEVHGIEKEDSKLFSLNTGRGTIQGHYVINAAGLFADEISRKAGARKYNIIPRRGEYSLLDSKAGDLVKHVIFQIPGIQGKGVLITPTVDGNILIGPSAIDTEDKFFTGTTKWGQDFVLEKGEYSVPAIPHRQIINSFSGMRAIAYDINDEGNTGTPVNDFIIEEDKIVKGFFNVGGITSPGLTAAPAIACYITELLQKSGLNLHPNKDYATARKGIERFRDAVPERKAELIESNPLYGRIICRCEMITEAEIIQSIHSVIGATDIDGIKRRVRTGMGRCQGGFCLPRVTEIISRELNIPMINVTKNGGCSYILDSRSRQGGDNIVQNKKNLSSQGIYTSYFDIVIIGGGPAGLAAAIEAYKQGTRNILILEREPRLGGILLQCIHNGFGLHHFGEELTGPEYAGRFVDEVQSLGIEYKTDTMVLDISIEKDTSHKTIAAINTINGMMVIHTKAVIFAMGCRERTRGALVLPGTRPAGIFTAGSVQRFVNIEGYMPGKKIVILGSGDIGLIMARRLTMEGAEVKLICELMPFSSGLTRNIVQCIENFNIPLRFSHTITAIHGKYRVEGVSVCKVDKNRKLIPETEEYIDCDTLLLSVGLIPENEIAQSCGTVMDSGTSGPLVNERMETSIPGVFACGNVVHVHDLVDYVTTESMRAGNEAACYVQENSIAGKKHIMLRPGNRVRYIVPQIIDSTETILPVSLMFRSTDEYRNVNIVIYSSERRIKSVKKRIVRPGEMQIIELSPEQISHITHSVTVSIEIPEEDID